MGIQFPLKDIIYLLKAFVWEGENNCLRFSNVNPFLKMFIFIMFGLM